MTTAERHKQTLARQILHHSDAIDRLRETKPFTPGDYAQVARSLAEKLAVLEELQNLWTAFGYGFPSRLAVAEAAG